MGEPRLSDIAPDLVFKRPQNIETRRSSSLKTGRKLEELQHNDLMYFPIPTSEIEAPPVEGEDEEVFLSEDGARYATIKLIKSV